jgi:hypothetical protein
VTSIKLLWLPGPAHYRLRVFAGPSSTHRAFTGELTLRPVEAVILRDLLWAGNRALAEDAFSEAGWVEPAPAPAPVAAA